MAAAKAVVAGCKQIGRKYANTQFKADSCHRFLQLHPTQMGQNPMGADDWVAREGNLCGGCKDAYPKVRFGHLWREHKGRL